MYIDTYTCTHTESTFVCLWFSVLCSCGCCCCCSDCFATAVLHLCKMTCHVCPHRYLWTYVYIYSYTQVQTEANKQIKLNKNACLPKYILFTDMYTLHLHFEGRTVPSCRRNPPPGKVFLLGRFPIGTLRGVGDYTSLNRPYWALKAPDPPPA